MCRGGTPLSGHGLPFCARWRAVGRRAGIRAAAGPPGPWEEKTATGRAVSMSQAAGPAEGGIPISSVEGREQCSLDPGGDPVKRQRAGPWAGRQKGAVRWVVASARSGIKRSVTRNQQGFYVRTVNLFGPCLLPHKMGATTDAG